MATNDDTILGLMAAVTNRDAEPMTDAERDQFFDTILTLLLSRKERKDQTHDRQIEGQ